MIDLSEKCYSSIVNGECYIGEWSSIKTVINARIPKKGFAVNSDHTISDEKKVDIAEWDYFRPVALRSEFDCGYVIQGKVFVMQQEQSPHCPNSFFVSDVVDLTITRVTDPGVEDALSLSEIREWKSDLMWEVIELDVDYIDNDIDHYDWCEGD